LKPFVGTLQVEIPSGIVWPESESESCVGRSNELGKASTGRLNRGKHAYHIEVLAHITVT